MNEEKQGWKGPQMEQGDRVYFVRHPAQMETSRRMMGFVVEVSGQTCDIVTFRRGLPQCWTMCRHVDDPGGRKPTLFENDHYGLYKLADSEEKVRLAVKQSQEAVAACAEFARLLADVHVPPGGNAPSETVLPSSEPTKPRRGRPPKQTPVEAGDAV